MAGLLTYPTGPERCLLAGGSAASSCVRARALAGALDMAVTPDGRRVYVAWSGGVSVFARDPSTGSLTQASGPGACVSDTADYCRSGRALFRATSIAVSPDGNYAYVASPGGNVDRDGDRVEDPVEGGVAVLVRPVASIAARRASPVHGGRVRVTVRCLAEGPDERCRGTLALRSAKVRLGRPRRARAMLGSRTFAIPAGAKRSVAVPLSRRAIRVLRARRRLSVLASARAKDATGHTYTATRSLRLSSSTAP